jgi:hypothetical protein
MMQRKLMSILILYIALAMMLGHNFIGHHHHFEHSESAHHHEHDTKNGLNDWMHLFSHLQHGAGGLTFLIGVSFSDSFQKQISQLAVFQGFNFVFRQKITKAPPKVPPYISVYCHSQNFLPTGLRAPPYLIA